jgi:hypothetical protein
MDESDPYPTFLGIDCAFDNNAVLNLKKHHMSFEYETMHMVAPLDTYEGECYNDPVDEDAQISTMKIFTSSRGTWRTTSTPL